MGGNALSVPSVRLNKNTYDNVCNIIMETLSKVVPEGLRYTVIPHYKEKDSFGDLDILIESTSVDYLSSLKSLLNITESTSNGNVMSLGLPMYSDIFQIDLIKIGSTDYDFALRYFAYNDLGNLLGRVAKQFDLKLGFTGLYYRYGPLDNKQDILVTKDFSEALILLRYNSNVYETKFKEGFNTLEEIYSFVVSSDYCYADLFDLNKRSYKERSRDSKRTVYLGFLDYLTTSTIPTFKHSNPYIPANPPFAMMQELFRVSKTFTRGYHLYCSTYHLKQANKVFLNGKYITDTVGNLMPKALGEFIAYVKTHVEEDYFLKATEIEIKTKLKELCAKWIPGRIQ